MINKIQLQVKKIDNYLTSHKKLFFSILILFLFSIFVTLAVQIYKTSTHETIQKQSFKSPTYTLDKVSNKRVYILKQGSKLRGKVSSGTKNYIVFSPALDKSYLLTFKKDKWYYKIPENAKEGNYTLSIINTNLSGNLNSVKNIKVKIVKKRETFSPQKLINLQSWIPIALVKAQEEVFSGSDEEVCQADSSYYNQRSTEYSCQDGYRCYNDEKIDQSTSCSWAPLVHEDGNTYHCNTDLSCESATVPIAAEESNVIDQPPPSIDYPLDSTDQSASHNLISTTEQDQKPLDATRLPGGAYGKDNLICRDGDNPEINVLYDCSKREDGTFKACYNDYLQYKKEDSNACLFRPQELYFHCDIYDSLEKMPEGECKKILTINENVQNNPEIPSFSLKNAYIYRDLRNDVCGKEGYDIIQVPTSCVNGYRCSDQYFRDSQTNCVWQRGRPGKENEPNRCVAVDPKGEFNCGLKTEIEQNQNADNQFDRGFKDIFGDEYPVVLSLNHQLGIFPAVDLHQDPNPETGKKEIVYYNKEAYQAEFCGSDPTKCVTRFVDYKKNDWEDYFVNDPRKITDLKYLSASFCIEQSALKQPLQPILDKIKQEREDLPGYEDINLDNLLPGYNLELLHKCNPNEIKDYLSDDDFSKMSLIVAISNYYQDHESLRDLAGLFPLIDLKGFYDLVSSDPYLTDDNKKFVVAGILFDVGTGPLGKIKTFGKSLLGKVVLRDVAKTGETILEVMDSTNRGAVSRSVIRYYLELTHDAVDYSTMYRNYLRRVLRSSEDEQYYIEAFEKLLYKAINDPRFSTDKTSLTKALGDIYKLATEGSLNGYKLLDSYPGRFNIRDIFDQKEKLINFYLYDPEFAELILKGKITGIHGSSSGTLLSVMHNGLLPLNKLRENYEFIPSGERVFAEEAVNKTVSFFQWWDYKRINQYAAQGGRITPDAIDNEIGQWRQLITENSSWVNRENIEKIISDLEHVKSFLQISPKNELQFLHQKLIKENFPVAFLVNTVGRGNTDLIIPDVGLHSEFQVFNGVPVGNVKAILVPSGKIDVTRGYVEKLELDIKVYDLDILFKADDINIPAPKIVTFNQKEVTMRNLEKAFGEFLGEGVLGRTFVNQKDGVVVKIFKKGFWESGEPFDNSNLLQNELHKLHSGKAGMPKYLFEVTDEWGNLIGFGQEFVANSVTLSSYLKQGNKLTSEEIQDGIDQLRELHRLTGLPHGDVAYPGFLNKGNILVQTLFDENGNIIGRKIRFIDYFGNLYKTLDNNPRAVNDYRDKEVRFFKEHMMKEAWDGRGNPNPKRRTTVRL